MTSAFQRFCVHDGKPIPVERLIKSNLKALFCCDECRFADKHQREKERRRRRVLQGRCPECGRKQGKTLGGGNARVHVAIHEIKPSSENANFIRNRFERVS